MAENEWESGDPRLRLGGRLRRRNRKQQDDEEARRSENGSGLLGR